jgi:hypothetical protein
MFATLARVYKVYESLINKLNFKIVNEFKDMPEDETCNSCGQEIPDKCTLCDQFVLDPPDEDDQCEECGQELPDEDEESDEEEDSHEEHEYVCRKKGCEQPLCTICKRPLQMCPKCEREFDTDEDGSVEGSSEDDESSDEEEVPRKKRRRDAKDESESDAGDSEDSDQGSEEKETSKGKKKQIGHGGEWRGGFQHTNF